MWLKQSNQSVTGPPTNVKTTSVSALPLAKASSEDVRALLDGYAELAAAAVSELKKTTMQAVASSDEIAKVGLLCRGRGLSDQKSRAVARRLC